MNIPRQEALLAASIAFAAGAALLLARLFRARRHGLSIRMQIFLGVAGTVAVLFGGFSAIVIDRFEARAAVFAYRAARDDAQVVADLTERSVETLHLTLSQGARVLENTRALNGFTRDASDTRVQLLDRSGRVIFDTRAGARGLELSARPEVVEALAGRVDPVARLVAEQRVAAAVPILSGPNVVGAARVEKTTSGMASLMADVGPKVALLALLLAGAAALAAALIGRAMARPVEALTAAASRIASGERQAALPVPLGREVRRLTEAFESMRRELEQRHAVERLAADLSHELKNPVASIRAAAEVLDAAPDDPEAVKKFSARIAESASRMGALVADLLTLARAEAELPAAPRSPVDLAEAARAAAAQQAASGGRKQVAVRVDAGGPAMVPGDAEELRRAIENLVSNAIAFSPPGSEVRVRVARSERGWECAVEDRGPGVAPEIRDRIFQRFVTTRSAEGGTGLGLAIVRAIAERHGGTAELRSTGSTGSAFALVLPA